MPPILAAAVREARSNTAAIASSRRACAALRTLYDWTLQKAAGQPTVCSETCVGRIRYLGVLLYAHPIALSRQLTHRGDEAPVALALEPARITIAAHMERWLAHIQPQVSPKTYERYCGVVRGNILPALGGSSTLRHLSAQISPRRRPQVTASMIGMNSARLRAGPPFL
jgi:hypothetical protein